jgi:hypothetical protein
MATPFVIWSLTVFHYASPTPRAISETRFALQTFPSSPRPVLHRNRVAAGPLIRGDRSQAAAVQQPAKDQVAKKETQTINKQQSADAEKKTEAKSSGRCYVTISFDSSCSTRTCVSLDQRVGLFRSTLHEQKAFVIKTYFFPL